MTAEPPTARTTGEELPFFVYGTLRPGQINYGLYLRGRTAAEEPGWWDGAVLYEGPGYPYALEAAGGRVRGELMWAAAGEYAGLVAALDRLEEYAPSDPRSLYERVVRDVARADTSTEQGVAVRAWVYIASERLSRQLRAQGVLIPGGDWIRRTERATR